MAAHIRSMTTFRQEAQDPATAPERLHDLIHLSGDRGHCDEDAGWCREDVAANPNAGPDTLRELAGDQDDPMARFNAARNPSLDAGTLQVLAEDRLDFIADAARERLGPPLRPRPDHPRGPTMTCPTAAISITSEALKTRPVLTVSGENGVGRCLVTNRGRWDRID